MAKIKVICSIMNGDLLSMDIVESYACSCEFVNEGALHFFFVSFMYQPNNKTSEYHFLCSTLHSKNIVTMQETCM